MADFAPNYTARYRVRYSVVGKSHSLTWRVASSVTDPAGVADKMELFLADMAPALFSDFTVIGADFALADSDIFLPAPAPASPPGDATLPAGAGGIAANAISFVGRSSLGGKARFFLYGIAYEVAGYTSRSVDYRFTSVENAEISDAVVRLNETAPALVANDDATAVWYEYVNWKANDKWVRKLRRG